MKTSFQKVRSPGEVAEVVRLAAEIWREHYEPIIGRRQVDYMLAKFQSQDAVIEQLGQAYEYYLVVRRGQNAGYLAVVPNHHEHTLFLSKLYVSKPERGNGLGRECLQFVEDLCRGRGLKLIWLTVNRNNVDSVQWYGRRGFKNAGPTLQDIGEGFVMDDFRMEKEIGPIARG
jgi:GNAT superfamily N-acetyltransferase